MNQTHSYSDWNVYIYKLDTNRQVVWGKEFISPVGPHPFNHFNHMIAAPDGSGYVAVGFTGEDTPGEDGYDSFGWLVKVSPEGDSLWGRYHHHVDNLFDDHLLYDIQATPDGGYIMGGEATIRYVWPPNPDTVTQQAWLIKVDEYGCLVPGCHESSVAISTVERQLDLKLYPNPASEYLNVWLRTPEWERDGQFSIINVAGQTVQTFKNKGKDATYVLSLLGYESGMYWLQYRVEGAVVRSLGFVVER